MSDPFKEGEDPDAIEELPPQPENWGAYPAPHYDEYDDCQCPDHVAMRQDRIPSNPLQEFIEGMQRKNE
jgi:hypothetical protein